MTPRLELYLRMWRPPRGALLKEPLILRVRGLALQQHLQRLLISHYRNIFFLHLQYLLLHFLSPQGLPKSNIQYQPSMWGPHVKLPFSFFFPPVPFLSSRRGSLSFSPPIFFPTVVPARPPQRRPRAPAPSPPSRQPRASSQQQQRPPLSPPGPWRSRRQGLPALGRRRG